MQIPDTIHNAVTTFHADWRHSRLAPPECSDLYSLFPQETTNTPTNANWPDHWPNADRPGVFLIFDPNLQLIYIDKSQRLGRRLNNYFRWTTGPGSACRIVHTGWKTRPMFIATIAATESFEAAALEEEYLVATTNPHENHRAALTSD